MTHGASETRVLVIRKRGTDLLILALEIIKGLLLRSGFRDKTTIKIDHFCKVGDTSGLLVNKDRGHVTIATSLET